MAGKKRGNRSSDTTGTGCAAMTNAAKKAKTHQEGRQLAAAGEGAPDEAPSSTVRNHRNDQVSELSSVENPNVPPLNHTHDEVPLQVIPRLIVRDLWSEDAGEVKEALIQLSDLCLPSDGRTEDEADANGEEIFEHGGHAVILRTLHRFPDVMDVQEECCRAILNATSTQPNRFGKLVGAIGTIEAILKTMTTFPQSLNLQKSAISAISNLLFCRKENAERLVNARGPEAVVATMAKFPGDNEIQGWGCLLIYNCIEHLENRDHWIELDALVVVSRAIKNHREHEEVKRFARKALAALAGEDF